MSAGTALPATHIRPAQRITNLRGVFGRDWVTAWVFLTPALLVMVLLIAYPFVSAILLSFQAKLVGTPGVWVGFKNYEDLLVGVT